MAKRMTFKDHIRRSVEHDDITEIGRVLILRNRDEVMTCDVVPGGDTHVRVARRGEPWRETWANDTSKIDQMWSR